MDYINNLSKDNSSDNGSAVQVVSDRPYSQQSSTQSTGGQSTYTDRNEEEDSQPDK